MDLMDAAPSIEDLRRRARARAPHVAWEYLDSGTGLETGVAANRAAMKAVRMIPRFFVDASQPDTRRELFGRVWDAPFGVAPVGVQSLMWPGAELMLAQAARAANLPYTLSTVAGEDLEKVGPAAGESFWFQLYTPTNPNMRADLIDRAAEAGAEVMTVTVDVPAASRRERQRKAGVGMPPRMTPAMIARVLMRPAWLKATLARGIPSVSNLRRYASKEDLANFGAFVGQELTVAVTPELFSEIRGRWQGKLLVKGIMDPEDARRAVELGADGIWVSNHGARQIDFVQPAIEALPRVVEAVNGNAKVVMDSGVRDGHDVARAVALGADFVFLGRAMMYGVMAYGAEGAAHAMRLIHEELANVMTQLGAPTLEDLAGRLDPLNPARAA
ncbi:MAG: alpha-hydroxy acid oxidase [Pseudomonadota bacterium]